MRCTCTNWRRYSVRLRCENVTKLIFLESGKAYFGRSTLRVWSEKDLIATPLKRTYWNIKKNIVAQMR